MDAVHRPGSIPVGVSDDTNTALAVLGGRKGEVKELAAFRRLAGVPAEERDDLTRRSTLRVLARAVQLAPDGDDWARTLTDVVAFGDTVTTDPVLATEERALAWRGSACSTPLERP